MRARFARPRHQLPFPLWLSILSQELELFVIHRRMRSQDAQKGRPARPQAVTEPEAYPQGYVEDSCELRTKLADFFNSLLELVLRHAISQCIAGDLEEPACFGNIAACALQCFLATVFFSIS